MYRARDTRLQREVAIKVLGAGEGDEPGARGRIEREARLIAAMNHPNILALYDIGTTDGVTYLVTELVDGDSLRGQTPPIRKALEIGAQVADALAAAHAAGITHRDLKPDNVMVTHEGRVKLLDFGVARQHRAPSDLDATGSVDGALALTGTIGYMAPEQLRFGDGDGRADVFAFGVLLYELLSGASPFPGATAADVMSAVLTGDPRPLPSAVPAAVRDIVQRCLANDPGERFQSAHDLAFTLRQAAAAIASSPDASAPPAVPVPSPAAIREHLATLLASPSIGNAERLAGLLRFLVNEALGGRQDQLKEMRLGLEVFRRKPDSYDPAFDPIVRVQMGRLRAKLRAYYAGPGATAAVRIDVPVGSYVPTFSSAAMPTAAPSVVAPPRPGDDVERMAVLPIVNMSADQENQYFCDGLTEELINHLAQVRHLRVVARTSSFQFRDAARDIREVGRLLDVSKVLEGSVRKSGNRIRITIQLINVSDGCHVWSERYDRDLTDIFAIHEEISRSVQRALQQEILGAGVHAPAPHPPQGLAAYNEYLQGRFQWKKRTEDGLRRAIDHFTEASRIDPTYARAVSGIADCYLLLGMSAAAAPDACMPNAAAAARQAVRLDDRSAETQASHAAVSNCVDWDFGTAESGYQRAIALDPSYATAYHWLAIWTQAALGRLPEAIASLEQAVELDPLSPPIIADLGLAHALAENYDAAAMYCRRALALDPQFHRPYWFLGLASAWRGDGPAAAEYLAQGLQRCPGAAFRARLLGALGFTYGRLGDRGRAEGVRRDLEALGERSYVPAFELAQLEMGLGNHAGALACLEHAVVHRDTYAIFIKSWSSFAPLRQHPRFQALLPRVGLA